MEANSQASVLCIFLQLISAVDHLSKSQSQSCGCQKMRQITRCNNNKRLYESTTEMTTFVPRVATYVPTVDSHPGAMAPMFAWTAWVGLARAGQQAQALLRGHDNRASPVRADPNH